VVIPFNDIYAQYVPEVIVFSKTVKYRHKSIEAGIKSIREMGKKNHFRVTATEDSDVLIKNLDKADAVIFLSTSGDVLNDAQQEKFRTFIENGGGFVGIHCAAATEYDWPWFGELLGAYFLDHPRLQDASIEVVNHNHPSTSFLDKYWVRYDEWYNFRNISKDIQVLLNLDESSYSGGKHGKDHPIAWFREHAGRKMFYTGLGHTTESFRDTTFLRHLSGGILYVLDKN
jgi:type 1 glutamine amidotransferase